MDKIIELNDIAIIKKACRILELLDKDFDKEKLKQRIDICKEIVALFESDIDYLEEAHSKKK